MFTNPKKNLTEIYSKRKISFKILILVGVGWWRVGNHQLRNCSTSWEGAKLADEGKLCRAFHFTARALNEILTKEIHELNQFDFVWFLYFSDFISSPPQSGAAGETGRSKTKWAKMWNSSASKFVREYILIKQKLTTVLMSETSLYVMRKKRRKNTLLKRVYQRKKILQLVKD